MRACSISHNPFFGGLLDKVLDNIAC